MRSWLTQIHFDNAEVFGFDLWTLFVKLDFAWRKLVKKLGTYVFFIDIIVCKNQGKTLWDYERTICVTVIFYDSLPLLFNTGIKKEKNRVRINELLHKCESGGAIKLLPFGTSAKQSEACVLKGCNFIATQASIQHLYY